MYLTEVGRSNVTYWLPGVTEVASFNSRLVLSLWGILHFIRTGLFWISLILTIGIGAAVLLLQPETRKPLIGTIQPGNLPVVTIFLLIQATIFYTILMSTTVSTGDPHYRVPLDPLISMSILMSIPVLTMTYRTLRKLPKTTFQPRSE